SKDGRVSGCSRSTSEVPRRALQLPAADEAGQRATSRCHWRVHSGSFCDMVLGSRNRSFSTTSPVGTILEASSESFTFLLTEPMKAASEKHFWLSADST